MSFRSNAAKQLKNCASSSLKVPKPGAILTENEQPVPLAGLPCFVRWCRSFTTLNGLKTLMEVGDEVPHLKTSLAKEVFNELDLAAPVHDEMSVYRSETRQATSIGHAMAVIAVAIGADDFRPFNADGSDRAVAPRHSKKVGKREGATLLLDYERSEAKLDVPKTPDGCTTIFVAADYHHDVRYDDTQKLNAAVEFVREELEQTGSLLSVCPLSPQPFNIQAKTILSHCKAELNNQGVNWRPTSDFDVSEQVARLRRLAALIDFDLSA